MSLLEHDLVTAAVATIDFAHVDVVERERRHSLLRDRMQHRNTAQLHAIAGATYRALDIEITAALSGAVEYSFCRRPPTEWFTVWLEAGIPSAARYVAHFGRIVTLRSGVTFVLISFGMSAVHALRQYESLLFGSLTFLTPPTPEALDTLANRVRYAHSFPPAAQG